MRHWHAAVAVSYGGYDSPEEYEVEEWCCQSHAEAIKAHGKDDPFYVYEVDATDCLEDDPPEWWEDATSAAMWGRND